MKPISANIKVSAEAPKQPSHLLPSRPQTAKQPPHQVPSKLQTNVQQALEAVKPSPQRLSSKPVGAPIPTAVASSQKKKAAVKAQPSPPVELPQILTTSVPNPLSVAITASPKPVAPVIKLDPGLANGFMDAHLHRVGAPLKPPSITLAVPCPLPGGGTATANISKIEASIAAAPAAHITGTAPATTATTTTSSCEPAVPDKQKKVFFSESGMSRKRGFSIDMDCK